MNDEYQKQIETFLRHDAHSGDVITLFDCLMAAFGKLSPVLQDVTKKRFETALIDVRRDIAVHLGEHIEATARKVNEAKSN